MRAHVIVAAVLALGLGAQADDVAAFPRLASGRTPGQFALADLNGDARLDVVIPSLIGVASPFDGTISVLHGDGWGAFDVEHVGVTNPPFSGLVKAVAADVDGQFGLDVVTIGSGLTLLSLLDDGAGGWTEVSSASVTTSFDFLSSDFNLDGFADLAVAQQGSTCAILLGDGTGAFAPVAQIATGYIAYLAVADIDADGFDDLLITDEDNDALNLHLGDGTGQFSMPEVFPVGGQIRCLTVGDVDGDARPDVLIEVDLTTVRVLVGDPSGTLLPAAAVSGDWDGDVITEISLGDADGDGLLDLIVVSQPRALPFQAQPVLRVALGDGTGVFTTVFTGETLSSFFVEPADVDSDGVLDLVMQTSIGVTWLRGLGDATFAEAHVSTTYDMSPENFDVADIDGDGDIDAMIPHQYVCDFIMGLENDGTGATELGWVIESTMQFPSYLRLGDLDRDGDQDVVIAGEKTEIALADNGVFKKLPTIDSVGAMKIIDLDGDDNVDLVGSTRTALGDGLGGFSPLTEYGSSMDVDVADVDADGHLDVMLAKTTEAQVWVVYLEPSEEIVIWDSIADIRGGAAGDFNDDGNIDFAVCTDNGIIEVHYGDGQRGELARETFDVGGRLRDMSAVDVDNDGHLDLVAADWQYQAPRVLYGVREGFGATERLVTARSDYLEVADMTGDGRLDVITVGRQNNQMTISPFIAEPATMPVGGGVAGGDGEPLMKLQGSLTMGSDTALVVTSGPALARGFVVLGFAQLDAPLAGGVLVPNIDVLIPGVATDANGQWSASGPWPPGVPADTRFWLQVWLPDASASKGWVASDGVEVSVP